MISTEEVAELAGLVARGVASGRAVDVEGLGVFYPDRRRGLRFEAATGPRVFLAYVKEDSAAAERLFDELAAAGFRPWMDVRKLAPGQNWPRAIERAIDSSDFFVACFSDRAVGKRGGFQAEIRYALDCARRVPLEEIFMVPVRLTDCKVPRRIQREYQWVDLFVDWAAGVRELVAALRGRGV
jgi:hypothetical protein